MRIIAVLGAIVYFGARVMRTPQNRALWSLLAVLVLHLVGDQLQNLAYVAAADTVEAGGMAKLLQNIVLTAKCCGIAMFFLLSTGGQAARRRARWEAIPFVLAASCMVAAMYSTPASLRDHSFSTAPMHIPGVAGFYLAGGLYFIYITAVGAYWAGSYAHEADRRLGLGLRIASLGLAFMCAASSIRAVFVVIRASGGFVSPEINMIGLVLLVLAQPLIIAGLILGALLTLFARGRIWWRQRQQWQQLRPLWDLLHAVFPADALDQRQLTPEQERWAGWRIRHRWWRRIVEIRDGLVQLSPWMHAAGWRDSLPPDRQAAVLRTAAEWRRTGTEVPNADTIPVVAPEQDDLAADVQLLLVLSRSLDHQFSAAKDDHAAVAER